MSAPKTATLFRPAPRSDSSKPGAAWRLLAHRPHTHTHGRWDKLGIFASGLCLVHCLALPLLLPLLPALALIPHSGMHALLLIPVIALSALAVVPGYRHHRSRRVVGLAAAGVLLCSTAVLAEALFGLEGWDMPLTVAGGMLLVSGHLSNLRLSRLACAAPQA